MDFGENMQAFIEFINAKKLSDNILFANLKCSEEEGKILQFMAKRSLNGEMDFAVNALLARVFGKAKVLKNTHNLAKSKKEMTDFRPAKNANNSLSNLDSITSYLQYLPHIRNLIDLGWLSIDSLLLNGEELTLIELFNESVCLSHSFLKLCEEGTFNTQLPEIVAYSDQLDYLKDQFNYIDLLSKYSALKFAKKANANALSRTASRLKDLEEFIAMRLKITTKDLNILQLFKQHNLDKKEQIIFMALLKEEYSNTDEIACDMNTLLELVSNDKYDKIQNRHLLDDSSNMIKKGLIGYDEIFAVSGGFSRSFFINDDILLSIINPEKKKRIKNKLDNTIKEYEIFELLEPKYDMSEIILHDNTREVLENLTMQINSKVSNLLKLWGVKDKKSGIDAKILLYGQSGTGKTISALALAKSLKKHILSFDCSKILSMYVGESEKNVRKIFDSYKDICKKHKNEPILLLDEADQFLSGRTSSGHSTDKMHNQMQNIFLEQIERFSGILIATTNLLENFDSAFSRRFNYKIEFKRPNLAQKKALWLKFLPKNAKYKDTNLDSLSLELAQYDLSGGQINLVVKNTAYKVASRQNPIFCKDDFIQSIKAELSSNFDQSKSMGFKTS